MVPSCVFLTHLFVFNYRVLLSTCLLICRLHSCKLVRLVVLVVVVVVFVVLLVAILAAKFIPTAVEVAVRITAVILEKCLMNTFRKDKTILDNDDFVCRLYTGIQDLR